jgi:hypothetical protein
MSMAVRRLPCSGLVRALGVLVCLGATPVVALAQVQEHTGQLPPSEAELRRFRQTLHQTVNLRGFPASMTLDEALEWLDGQVEADNVHVAVAVDFEAFWAESRRFSLSAITIRLPTPRRSMSVGEFLNLLTAQVPLGNAVLVQRSASRFEITTAKQLAREEADKRARASAETRRRRKILGTVVQVRDFKDASTLKEALGMLYERLAGQGIELAMLADKIAFQERMPGIDVYELPVRIPAARQEVTVRQFLEMVLDQVPTKNATFVIRHDGDYLEITTVERLAKEKQLPKMGRGF